MSCFLYVDDSDDIKKVNIDELYESKQRRDLKQVSIFNKILNRIQKKITTTSRIKKNDRHVWFTVPEYIFGEPIYDKGDCIAYLITKLEENGFFIRYMHPNTLFISWENWVPSYVRTEIKKKKGIVIDEKGNVIDKKESYDEDEEENMNSRMLDRNTSENTKKNQKNYTPIGSYKPTGNLVYNKEIFEKIEKRVI